MITINVLLKKRFRLVPHPTIKNRYTIPYEDCEEYGRDFGSSVTRFSKQELVKYLRHKDFDVFCRIFQWERNFYPDGRRKEPRDAEWFREHHPEFYVRNFTLDGGLNSGYDINSLSEELKADLDIYEGILLVPYTPIISDKILINGELKNVHPDD